MCFYEYISENLKSHYYGTSMTNVEASIWKCMKDKKKKGVSTISAKTI